MSMFLNIFLLIIKSLGHQIMIKMHLKQRLLSIYSDVFESFGNNYLTLKMTGDRLVDAALLMKLIMYRNICLHLFAKPAYILLACQINCQV